MEPRWQNRHTGRADRGAGQLSTMIGVLVFLVFLLFALQLLTGLLARTTASDAALLGAQRVARGSSAADARADVSQLVGSSLIDARPVPAAEDPTADPDYVRYRVTIEAPDFLGAPWLGRWATGPIVRDGRARVERQR